jgi:hypothetical protein
MFLKRLRQGNKCACIDFYMLWFTFVNKFEFEPKQNNKIERKSL